MNPRYVNTAFLVEPREAVTFGPPRPFDASEAHRMVSQFPPSPRTFQGLVRTQLLLGADPPLDLDDRSPDARAERAALVGGADALPEGWQLRGPWPARVGRDKDTDAEVLEPWVPAPRFLLRHGSGAAPVREIRSTHPGLDDLHALGAGRPLLGRPDLDDAAPLEGWIGPDALAWALAGEGIAPWPSDQWRPDLPPFVHGERQPGVAIDPATGSAQAGMLYFLHGLRFEEGSGLFGHLRGVLDARLRPAALTTATGSAGRKGRWLILRESPPAAPAWSRVLAGEHLPAEPEGDARFWLYSLAPAWLPDPLRPVLRPQPPAGIGLEVLAALTGRAQVLGGYDMAAGRPRPNRRYCPAGSAWLLRLSGGTPAARGDYLRRLHDAHPLGPPEEAAMGFGHTLVGLGPPTTEEVR